MSNNCQDCEYFKKTLPLKVHYPIDMYCKINKKAPYCYSCGKHVKDQKYCHNCGQKLDWS